MKDFKCVFKYFEIYFKNLFYEISLQFEPMGDGGGMAREAKPVTAMSVLACHCRAGIPSATY